MDSGRDSGADRHDVALSEIDAGVLDSAYFRTQEARENLIWLPPTMWSAQNGITNAAILPINIHSDGRRYGHKLREGALS